MSLEELIFTAFSPYRNCITSTPSPMETTVVMNPGS